ncbi:MAG: hypothetical protein JWO82_3329 [Akkermansiaceae bacterium]|nr:hypothetical protein [Akkermansiaceae bacterium]
MHPDPVPPAHAPHLPCPAPARRLILAAALLCAVNAAHGAVILKDDFSAYGTNSNNVNLNLPATDGSPYSTTKIRQSGSVGTWSYLEGGTDANSQIGNPATNAGQAGAPTYADYLLLAYTCSASSRLPINEALVQGQPLTISFDLGTVAAPTSPDNTWWSAFRLGPLGSTYPVVGGDADFAFLYRINKGVQVFTTGAAGVDIPPVTSSHFTMVFTGSDGTGSAFSDKGSRVALYSGTTLLGRFDTGQLTQEFMNFSVQNAFASLDNLVVETGIPDFVANAFHLTQSAFDFTSGKLNLTWVSEAGKTYQVTHSNTLTGTWQPIGAMIDAVGALTSTSIDFVETGKDFYRVEEIVPGPIVFDGTQVKQDTVNRQLFLSDSQGKLQLRLNYAGRAVLDRVQVNDTETIAAGTGACTGVQVAGNWVTTRTLATDPVVTISGNDVTLSQINYGVGGVNVSETWVLHTGAQGIQWDIQRQYLSGGLVDDTYFPGFDFKSMSTWTAGMLDTGGVAWGRYLGTNASYGAHSGSVTFFKDADCLKITTLPGAGTLAASRFSHQPSGAFTFGQTIATTSMAPKHDLRRSIAGVDLWKSFQVTPGTLRTSLTLEAKDANAVRYRGNLTGIDGAAVNDLLDTIGRYGVIDKTLMGGNGWLTGYICLHEPFHAEMGIALGSPDYTANMATSLNGWRDYALQSSGRVKSRWHHDTSDNTVPGSYDFATGYYECGWGTLIDSQPDYVINVAEQFDLSGDLTWLQAH